MKTVHRMLSVLLHAWPQKLGAVVLASVIWLFVNVNDTSVTHRSLFVPITVEGLAEDSVATGLPDYVEVTVSGPSGQVDRLRPDNFEAILDLSGQNESFEVPIRVLSPQGLDLRRVNPSDVIGSVEAVTEKRVPLIAVVVGPSAPDVKLQTSVDPVEIVVRARASTLARVTRALAPVRPSDGERSVAPYAVDAGGQPVSGVVMEPDTVTVRVEEKAVLVRERRIVELETPALTGFSITARMEEAEAELIGPPSILESIERVQGTVSLPTEGLEAGGYTLPVTLELPEGVFVVGTPTATVRLSRPPARQ